MMRILVLLFPLMLVGADAENWTQFRGPNSQGRSSETGVVLAWSTSENVAWKTPLPGEAWSSPIVWQDTIFVTTATEDKGLGWQRPWDQAFLIALDAKSGKERWKGWIYFTGDSGETTVVEAAPRFQVLARNSIGEKVQASLAVSQGQIFIRTERNLLAIGKRSP